MSTASQKPRSPASTSTPDRSCALAASIPYWDSIRATESFRLNADSIDYLSMFWYHLDPDGTIRRYKKSSPSRDLIEMAQSRGAKVLALITNLPDDEREGPGLTWDAPRVGEVLGTEQARSEHVEALVQLTRRMGFDGIHIDYEALEDNQRESFTLFVKELGAELRDVDKLLAVAIHGKTSEGDPSENNGSRAQDWAALHPHVDQLHFMTYSQHTATTDPGPVADPEWVSRILRYAVRGVGVPREKIFVGLPLYAEEWRRHSSGAFQGVDRDLTYADAQRRRRKHDGVEHWSDEHDSPYIVYRDKSDRERVIWFENRRSSETKLAHARELGLCNMALWRLGGEDPAIWPLFRKVFEANR